MPKILKYFSERTISDYNTSWTTNFVALTHPLKCNVMSLSLKADVVRFNYDIRGKTLTRGITNRFRCNIWSEAFLYITYWQCYCSSIYSIPFKSFSISRIGVSLSFLEIIFMTLFYCFRKLSRISPTGCSILLLQDIQHMFWIIILLGYKVHVDEKLNW